MSSMSSDLGSDSDASESDVALSKVVKGKRKAKIPARAPRDGSGKDEGEPADWAYHPPADATLVEHNADLGEFDWDKVRKDDDTEIWLIRIPQGFKPKMLTNIKLDDLPVSSETARVGTVARKSMNYNIWSVGSDDHPDVCGEELKNLQCLLPRKVKRGGKLYQARKPISRHLVVAAQPVQPTPPETGPQIHQNPPRQSYSKEWLKHRFMPVGSQAVTGDQTQADEEDEEKEEEEGEDVEMQDIPVQPVVAEAEQPATQKKKSKKNKESTTPTEEAPTATTSVSTPVSEKKKGKKRKVVEVDGEVKKRKKAKVDAHA